MTANKNKSSAWLQTSLLRLCRVHFAIGLAYAAYIIAADANHLIVPEIVLRRFFMDGLLIGGASVLWYLASYKRGGGYYRVLIYLLVLLDISLAAFSIYTQRGMASRGVMLFSLPIVVSAISLSRRAIYTTASLSAIAYVVAAVKYFVDNFNEGYKSELYIEVGFYCAVFFSLAAVLTILVGSRNADT